MQRFHRFKLSFPRFISTAFLLALLLGATVSGSAQVAGGDAEFDRLFDLYAMDNVEDCLWKAQRLTEKEKYRKNAEPSLYVAMCFWQVHNTPSRFEGDQYRKPFKNAIKYALKGMRKDKEGVLYEQNKALFVELKLEAIARATGEMDEQDFRKAASWLKKAHKLDESDAELQLALGISQILYNNVSKGRANMEAARTTIEAQAGPEVEERLEPVILELVLAWSQHIEHRQNATEAMAAIELGMELLGYDSELKARLEELEQATDQG